MSYLISQKSAHAILRALKESNPEHPAVAKAEAELTAHYSVAKEQQAEILADTLLDYVNSCPPAKSVSKFIRRGHRTLQQSIFDLFLGLVADWAKDYIGGNYDGRNEYTAKTCHEIVERCGDTVYFASTGRFTPFI